MEYHFQWFSRLCCSLEGYTHTCVISFLDMYRKIKGRMDRIQTRAMTGEDMVSLASFMGPEAERHGMTVRTLSLIHIFAIPFFILSGNLMAKGGISTKLVDLSSALVGHIKGCLLYTSRCV